MIYFFTGNQRERAQKKVAQVIAAFKRQNPEGTIFRLEEHSFDPAQLLELLSSRSLFGEKRLVVGLDLGEHEGAKQFLSDHLPEIVASPTVLLWLALASEAKIIEQVKKAGGRVEKFSLSVKEFNSFAITDAFGARDRAGLWLQFQRALAAGLPAEEIFWKLVWQVKNLLLVSRSETLTSLSPFVAKKAREFSHHFSFKELGEMSSQLVRLWHETKREEGRDFALELEYFLLGV